MGSDPNYQSLKNEIEHIVQFARNNEFIDQDKIMREERIIDK